jgi:hypothetical protein
VNYSLLILETAEMMKMASDDAFSPLAGCRKRGVDEIVEVQRLAAAEKLIEVNFRGFLNIYDFSALDSRETEPRGPHEVPGHAWGVARPGASWAASGPPLVGIGSSIFYLFHKKSPKSFSSFGEL